ncbi:hypothetical protein ACFYU9_07455 [Streptomyces sp. NPDC004327]|uniref:hypothetical protein n=1 Tax=unclassified Streptomyces TaxID=2593676 RepID=UPI0036C9A56A
MAGILLFTIPLPLGAALVFDIKGFRQRFAQRPGESEAYARRLQGPAIFVGWGFLILSVAAIVARLIYVIRH